MMNDDVPLKEKLSVLNGVIDTRHVNEWENSFLKSIVPVAQARALLGQVMGLTPKQSSVLDTIYDRVA